jgi:N-acetylglucosaminyldiphosphoundecaprenol N-acetyl-beta-D-mannosaminyltransferase
MASDMPKACVPARGGRTRDAEPENGDCSGQIGGLAAAPRPARGKPRKTSPQFLAAAVPFREARALPFPRRRVEIWSEAMQLAAKAPRRERRSIVHIGRLPIDVANIQETAQAFVDYCRSEARNKATRPIYSTSVNGQVISLCARDRKLAEMFQSADSVNADGQPLVFLSRFLCANPLPERVATTDLFPAVAHRAAANGVTFYMLGGSEEVNRKATEAALAEYPGLRILGRRNGYFSRDEEAGIVAEVAELKPDVLWLSLGVPLEQQFCMSNLNALRGVGIVKTSGGLFDFLARAKPRAPMWMQKFGLEWLFRTAQEPRRLFWRYLVTNPHALYLMVWSLR